MYKFLEKGISPREFRKCRSQDIKDMIDLDNTIQEKTNREIKIKNMMNEMKR